MPTMPTDASSKPNRFDRFADKTTNLVSHAAFFAFCVLMVVLWFPTLFIMPIDSSQLIINTTTTIITFLMVALLESRSKRDNDALQQKLNALARALAHILEDMPDHEGDIKELLEAVGLEEKEST